jgi:hypothetical protein
MRGSLRNELLKDIHRPSEALADERAVRELWYAFVERIGGGDDILAWLNDSPVGALAGAGHLRIPDCRASTLFRRVGFPSATMLKVGYDSTVDSSPAPRTIR